MKKIFLVITKMTNLYDRGEAYEYHAFFSEEAANKYASEHTNGQDCEYWYDSIVEQIQLDTCIYNGEEGCLVVNTVLEGFLHFHNKETKELDSINLDFIRELRSVEENTLIVSNEIEDDWPNSFIPAVENEATLTSRCDYIRKKFVKTITNWCA